MTGWTTRRQFLKRAMIGAVAVGSFGGPAAARRVSGTQPAVIDGPTTITDPGRYEIASDITSDTTDAIIRIQASDVVLDGRGHTLRGTGEHAAGGSPVGVITEADARNVVVRHVAATGLFFGFSAVGPEGRFEAVAAAGNRGGVLINHSVHRTTITDSIIAHNTHGGIAAVSSDAHVIVRNLVASNGSNGITLRQGCSECTIAENVVQHNGERGLTAWEGGDGHVVVDNVVAANGIDGIAINDVNPVRARDLFLARNSVVGNGRDGLFLRRVDRSRVARNVVVRNGDDGVELDDADGNVVKRTVAVENGGDAIRISSDSSGNRVWGNLTGW